MLISELIQRLQDVKAVRGDIPCGIVGEGAAFHPISELDFDDMGTDESPAPCLTLLAE